MPSIVDTSIRLLTQEPLAGRLSTARVLEVAELLDKAGFAALEISGGGCFASFVERGVESPWEIVRALRTRCKSPLAMALRGRFLVGSRPASREVTHKFVATAAANGIDIFRIHDPLNDLSNLTDAADAIRESGKRLSVGLIYNAIEDDDGQHLVDLVERMPELHATSVVIDDPAGALDAHHARGLAERIRETSGLDVGLSAHGAAGRALAAAVEVARGESAPIGAALYPIALSLYRPSAEILADTMAGLDLPTSVDTELLWRAVALIGDSLDDVEATSLAPSVAAKAARRKVPTWLVEQIVAALAQQGLSERLDDVLIELDEVRVLAGAPPLVAPIGEILGSQALVNVLASQRWAVIVDDFPGLVQGEFGSLPRAVDPAVLRTIALRGAGGSPPPAATLEEVRAISDGIASSDEDVLLLALFGDRARPLLSSMRQRGSASVPLEAQGVERGTASRIRELIEIVESSDIGEVTVEEEDFKVTVRRCDVGPPDQVAARAPSSTTNGDVELPVSNADLSTLDSPMVGTFYSAPQPDAPAFVEVGDTVAAGQTLCILEAMKLMNEVKAENDVVVRKICVENAEAVEYGQPLFELELLGDRPPDAVA